MKLIIKILLSAIVVMFLAYLLPGVRVHNYLSAVIVALVIGVLNTIVKPILIVLTLPITILTLGFFLLVINAFIILFAGKLVDGFGVDGFWWALIFSLLLSVLQSMLNSALNEEIEE
ncbi:membrane protein [Neptunitalea chrysea]|uniref:Membrane protein n=1 Tax=Neptunitalea chrysea TaxID=1647581 RepID=A0A9W6B3T6_9FLAO|nr:phage holin family protein [Neptunitalea chrysea]GLB51045.1 membrane protein [Neptunitalea chrysea]